jgi:ribosome maturation factor RimP
MEGTAEREIKGGVDLGRVRAAIGPILSAHGVELSDLEFLTERAGWTLRVTIERPGASDASGGITLDDCAEVSRDVSQVLDVEDLIPHHYNLEVSSPGIERPLKTEADFVRFRGKPAKVKLARPAPDGQRLLRGTLVEAPAGAIAVIVDGKRIEVPYGDVVAANLVFELETQPKPTRKAKTDKSGGGAKPARSKR